MILIISGTNRPGSKTAKVAALTLEIYRGLGAEATLLDLKDLPATIMDNKSYAEKPQEFAPFQQAILEAEGIVVVTPEYNGSFPGILKYFIDMLKFPESLHEKPVAFIGLAAGQWGALRSVEQLSQIFQYRSAHLYGRRVLMPKINDLLDGQGHLKDEVLRQRLENQAEGFMAFVRAFGAVHE